MTISVQCAGCGRKLRVQDDLAGGNVRCPGCRALVAVPAEDEDEEQPRRRKKRRTRRGSSGGGEWAGRLVGVVIGLVIIAAGVTVLVLCAKDMLNVNPGVGIGLIVVGGLLTLKALGWIDIGG
jgi:hypothetical protein